MIKKNEFTSKYTDKKVSAAAFLCDFIMEKIAAKQGKTLPWKYWATPEWGKAFKRQLVAANKLLEEVNLIHVMAFLRSKAAYKILSLGLYKQIVEGSKKFVVVYKDEKDLEGEEGGFVIEDDSFVALCEDSTIEVKFVTGMISQWEILNG